MKRAYILLLLLLSVLTLVAAAQQSGAMPPGHQMLADPETFADGHVAALDARLHLSADQKAKLRPVFLEEGKRLFAVLSDDSLPLAQKQAAIAQLHSETAAKVDSLLTPEQRRQAAPPNPSASPVHNRQT